MPSETNERQTNTLEPKIARVIKTEFIVVIRGYVGGEIGVMLSQDTNLQPVGK